MGAHVRSVRSRGTGPLGRHVPAKSAPPPQLPYESYKNILAAANSSTRVQGKGLLLSKDFLREASFLRGVVGMTRRKPIQLSE